LYNFKGAFKHEDYKNIWYAFQRLERRDKTFQAGLSKDARAGEVQLVRDETFCYIVDDRVAN
tara:strand:- start:215 stop:400 length:186 start_codon:yes stop_codon:yes gene_type:complete